ncbi:hypothetical protein [Limosilactobacillus sp.]|jgi:hypothetical protein|uniref:hypothetical protein n=1 Tax=Limosilactobacillus sp. TaxID=2773925 RepID=UPI0025BE2628|nr:hypothetical protein [Limosilactobacillus sp.]MCH3922366.1 hypothetical protein [Limosilactobacillus sp.]MCH3929138.1 hypothetical protein [Limosilactobacillus sp.]
MTTEVVKISDHIREQWLAERIHEETGLLTKVSDMYGVIVYANRDNLNADLCGDVEQRWFLSISAKDTSIGDVMTEYAPNLDGGLPQETINKVADIAADFIYGGNRD